MNPSAEHPPEGPKGPTWLDPLSAKGAKGAGVALAALAASLPADAAAAGDGLPMALAAWILVDPEVAARWVEAWLATMDAAGNLSPACPVVCQLAERVADALPDPEKFVSGILPGLARGLEREFNRYDIRGTGLPHWPTAEEALFPKEFAPGRFTVDLAVLVSNETSAFIRLAKGQEQFEKTSDLAEGEQRELDGWLKDNFWDEELSAFYRHDESLESVPDDSPCGFFPLVWEGRTPEMVEGLRMRATEWNSAAWSARGWTLFFSLLLHTPHNSVIAQMRRTGLPAGASPVEAAVWTVLVAGADGARASALEEIPPAVRWLDAHGRGIARGLLAGSALLLAGLLGWQVFHRENLSFDNVAELERRARLACEEGKHARAAALYGQAARRGHETFYRYRQAGEWMHLAQFADAEAAYRGILKQEPNTPNARLNLALSVLRQDRREEALELYRAFAAEAGSEAHPELAARAGLAAALIEQQLALDLASSIVNREP